MAFVSSGVAESFRSLGGTVPSGITCRKISCYMRDSASRGLIFENAKIFRSLLKFFDFFYVKEIVQS